MPTANRRHFERFPFSSRLEVRCQRAANQGWTEGGPQVAPAVALDVSVGGFGFRSTLPLSVGDLISVTLPAMDRDDLGFRDAEPPLRHSSPPADPWLEIVAVVRHVSREADAYIIGAERHGDQA